MASTGFTLISTASTQSHHMKDMLRAPARAPCLPRAPHIRPWINIWIRSRARMYETPVSLCFALPPGSLKTSGGFTRPRSARQPTTRLTAHPLPHPQPPAACGDGHPKANRAIAAVCKWGSAAKRMLTGETRPQQCCLLAFE